jgi:hypothetical protein
VFPCHLARRFPRLWDEPGDRSLRTLDRHPLASVGTLVLGLRMVSGIAADAEAARALRPAAGDGRERPRT